MTDQQQHHLSRALCSAIILDKQLNILLDLYDFFVSRHPADTSSMELEIRDLSVSIKSLGELPKHIAVNLIAWRENTQPTLSQSGFELHVLNEMLLHMQSLAYFFSRKQLDLEPYSATLVQGALDELRFANIYFSTPKIT